MPSTTIRACRCRCTGPGIVAPVRARGIARLRMLLSDSDGPLYRPGRGSLAAALRGGQAAL